ncbi:TetR family transcriptional regulator C-terminal domain-containing protein [Phenylobacterium sp.]|uniref:TetR/AcrR family transcriptional regulator n=1 Tax=Phenylobacterium sp. TaxID=1871053 RepID=UPI00391A6B9A
MARPSHRDTILCEGLKVIHEKGFAGASVRDIVRAAGVPQGSFTNHFPSKEAFGLEVLNLYFEKGRHVMDETVRNRALPPLKRMEAYLDQVIAAHRAEGVHSGCLIGNFTAEVVEGSELLRRRLVEIHDENRAAFAECLAEAVEAGELSADFDVAGTAEFIVAGVQGAILLAKARREVGPLEAFRKLLFASVLR